MGVVIQIPNPPTSEENNGDRTHALHHLILEQAPAIKRQHSSCQDLKGGVDEVWTNHLPPAPMEQRQQDLGDRVSIAPEGSKEATTERNEGVGYPDIWTTRKLAREFSARPHLLAGPPI